MASRLRTLWNGRMIAHPRRCHPMKFHLSPRDRDESGHDFRTPIYGWFTEGFDTRHITPTPRQRVLATAKHRGALTHEIRRRPTSCDCLRAVGSVDTDVFSQTLGHHILLVEIRASSGDLLGRKGGKVQIIDLPVRASAPNEW